MTRAISGLLTRAVQQNVLGWGEVDRETGAFLLTRRDGDTVDMIAWPLLIGVVRERGQFAVSGSALSKLFEWCGERQLQITALLHSHKHEAFLSPVDLKYGFAVEGFLSTIVPDYANPSANPAGWGWWRFNHDAWIETTPLSIAADRGFQGVCFDERGMSSLEHGRPGFTPADIPLITPNLVDEQGKS